MKDHEDKFELKVVVWDNFNISLKVMNVQCWFCIWSEGKNKFKSQNGIFSLNMEILLRYNNIEHHPYTQ